MKFNETIKTSTVKPAVAATSIKRDPPISGHFRAPPNDFECKCTFIKRAPIQRDQLSTKFVPKRNSSQNAESVSLHGHLLAASLIKFRRF